ncbi:MAG: nuclear transport factor 2 family protein [Cyclobacteriaceae bacterium]|nr:nuclear transport factor 2 family protein [Cyclobacteriaceae bacterium]
MKKIFLNLSLVLIPVFAFAQSVDEKQVSTSVEILTKAIIDADKPTLNTLLSDNLSYGHSGGKVEDKSQFIESLMTKNSDFVTIALTEQTIKVIDNVAVVRHILKAETLNRGEAGSASLSVMLIWIRQNNQWKLLARQAVKV